MSKNTKLYKMLKRGIPTGGQNRKAGIYSELTGLSPTVIPEMTSRESILDHWIASFLESDRCS